MSVSFEFEATVRVAGGKAAARRLRASEDKVPAIVYGAGKEPMPISLSHNKIIRALDHEAIYSHILTLNIENEPEKVVLKAMMRHPTKPRIMHMDFLRINTKEKIHMRIPLHFVGETKSPGLKAEGVLSKLISHLDITCLPADLPEYIEVDISNLGMNESIHLLQLQMPPGVTFTHAITDEEHDQAVVNIHEPRAEEEPVEAPVAVETIITGQKAPEAEAVAATPTESKEKPKEKPKK